MMLFPQDLYDSIGQSAWYLMEKLTQLPDRFIQQSHRWTIINQFRKVIFVRHPFTRLVSAYQNKILDKKLKTFGGKPFLSYQSNTPVRTFEFKLVIHYYYFKLDFSGCWWNSHLQSICSICLDREAWKIEQTRGSHVETLQCLQYQIWFHWQNWII